MDIAPPHQVLEAALGLGVHGVHAGIALTHLAYSGPSLQAVAYPESRLNAQAYSTLQQHSWCTINNSAVMHTCLQVRRMVLCDRCGTRMPAVRATMEAKIGKVYRGLDLSIDCFPDDDVQDDPEAALKVGADTADTQGHVHGGLQS